MSNRRRGIKMNRLIKIKVKSKMSEGRRERRKTIIKITSNKKVN